MKKIALLIFLLSPSVFVNAQFDKIDHIYMNSHRAQTLYNFFKNKFQLPVAWPYQNFGDFSSGAVSFGNVAIEFGELSDSNLTEPGGIALLPHESIEKEIVSLDSLKVGHGSIEPFTFDLKNGTKDTAWETSAIKNILPQNIVLFICDYKHRKGYQKNKKAASDSLLLIHGGKLGIAKMEEIVISCKDVSIFSNQLAKLPGLKRGKNNLFKFGSGPSIRLIKNKSPGIEKIVIKVNSLGKTKDFLKSNNLLGVSSTHSAYIIPGEIEGLVIEFVDK